MTTQGERVTLRIPAAGKPIYESAVTQSHSLQCKDNVITDILNHFCDPDDESDTEVPYADIMITVRGVSTPELTQVGYLSPGDQKEVRDKNSESTYLTADRLFYEYVLAASCLHDRDQL